MQPEIRIKYIRNLSKTIFPPIVKENESDDDEDALEVSIFDENRFFTFYQNYNNYREGFSLFYNWKKKSHRKFNGTILKHEDFTYQYY